MTINVSIHALVLLMYLFLKNGGKKTSHLLLLLLPHLVVLPSFSLYFSLEIFRHISTRVGTMIVVVAVLNLGRHDAWRKCEHILLCFALPCLARATNRRNRNVETNCVFGLISLDNILMKNV